MFIFAFFASSLTFDNEDQCEGLNTIRTKDGKCKCHPLFKYGDPYSEIGCYLCIEKCHKLAICAPPGNCECINGLVGDGKTYCSAPLPQILDVRPMKVNKAGGEVINVKFTTETNYSAIDVYCKFGKNASVGKLIGENVIQCIAPKSDELALRISVSFDNVNFTTNQTFIQYYSDKPRPKIQIVWQVWATLLVVIIIYVAYSKMSKPKANEEMVSPDEKIAFAQKVLNDPVLDDVELEDQYSQN